jgi:hypothetical protein
MSAKRPAVAHEERASDDVVRDLVAAAAVLQELDSSMERLRARCEHGRDRGALRLTIMDATLHAATLVQRLTKMAITLMSEE